MTDPSDPPRSPSDPSSDPTPGHSDPPSVRLVLGVLAAGRRMTSAELRAASGLPRRTVYQALRVLRQRGAVRHRKSLQDTRQSYFWLAEAEAQGTVQTGAQTSVRTNLHDADIAHAIHFGPFEESGPGASPRGVSAP